MSARHFKSWRSYWRFEKSVRETNRFFRTREAATFLNTVLETSKPFHETWKAGTVLWRAQLGCDRQREPMSEGRIFERPYQYQPDRMLPPRDAASEGRANPKGIPYLYAATCRDTALAEVRPWAGSFISVGEFEVLKDLKIVNFTLRGHGKPSYTREPPPEERTAAVWAHIDMAFSEPVTPSDAVADYAPTQVVAEMFRNAKFDGIAYLSALGQGLNAALFDLDTVRLCSSQLFRAEFLQFTFCKVTSPRDYFPAEQEDIGEDGPRAADRMLDMRAVINIPCPSRISTDKVAK